MEQPQRMMVIKKAASLLVVLVAMLAIMLAAAAPALAQSAVGVATGVLEKPGATSYQYGTHAITDEASGTRYALQSESVNLDAHVGERVTIYGTPVPGYQDGQVEGGPDLLRVDRVVPADGAPPGELATLFFELSVECAPPAEAEFLGFTTLESVMTTPLTDPDGDGLYTGSITVNKFAPGGPPESITLSTVLIVQGGPQYRVITDFGSVKLDEDKTFSASVSFCDDGGVQPPTGGATTALPATAGASSSLLLPLVALLLGGGVIVGVLLVRRSQ